MSECRNSVGVSVLTFTLARKSEISFHMKCEVKVKVKSIRCFHVKSRTLSQTHLHRCLGSEAAAKMKERLEILVSLS